MSDSESLGDSSTGEKLQLKGDEVLGDKSSGVKPRERDSPSISLVGSVASPFSLQSQHPTKWHCEECGIPMPQRRGNKSRVRMKKERGKLLCHKCSTRENQKIQRSRV